MRKLTKKEKSIVRRSIEGNDDDYIVLGKEQIEDSLVEYRAQDNFTISVLLSPSGPIFIGVAKRNPEDEERDEVGERFALRRAAVSYPVYTLDDDDDDLPF